MKRLFCLILAVVMLWGCGAPATPTQTSPTVPTTLPTEPTVPATTQPLAVSPEVQELRESFPTIDGSTSLIPLEAGVRAAIFGISQEEATAQVIHSSTWNAFYHLISHQVDMILSCPLSQEQYQAAKDEHVSLELVPVAMEGFVFVVNAQNPVDTLTQQQIKDIYSGKITNWKEVGGNDEAIIPYQRNHESGSQNFMVEFMGDIPLMDAPVEMRPATMEGLMDVVAVNDNASASIGYSVYAYAANMYGNGNEIKFIRVDGVAPSKQTFADKSYPLLGKNYAVFNSREPEDSPVRKLVRWMTSYDGQLAIAKAGYVTEDDVGFDYEEMQLLAYQGTGTGPEATDDAFYRYDLTQVQHTEWDYDIYSSLLPVTVVDGVSQVTGLSNQTLQEEVNAFIREQMAWVPEAHEDFVRWVELQSQDRNYNPYGQGIPWEYGEFLPQELNHVCHVTASNGYLSVAVSVCGEYRHGEGFPLHYKTETATWDLLSGRRLEATDLFCRGVDMDAVLNEYIRQYSMGPADSWGTYLTMKQDFVALPQTGWHLTHDAIYIDQDNPYFHTGLRIRLNGLPEGTLAAEAPRAFEGAWAGENVLYSPSFRHRSRDIRYAYNADGLVSYGFLREEAHPNAAKINQAVLEHLNAHFTQEAILGWYEQQNVPAEQVDLWMLDWNLWNFGNRYLIYQGNGPYHIVDQEADRIPYPFATVLVYDLDSGREIGWEALLKEGWRTAATTEWYPQREDTPLPETGVELESFYQREDGALILSFRSSLGSCTATVPWDYVNHKG